ncbi:hypothetical protein [uncultured Megasphaera sp.]|uniref:hypothetical protein n=1 Tax=uncultured Megasphaera sp. TaxID=165188 RepID=UPI002658FE91|nr:hypothetical protein [uncultured Megasphaera sp.]
MSMKRANGTGSVYKLKRRLKKPFKAVITVVWKDDGTRIRKCIGYFAKSTEAYDALSSYRHAPEQFENKDITFAQAWEWMIDEKKRQGVDIKKGKFSPSKKKCAAISRCCQYIAGKIFRFQCSHCVATVSETGKLDQKTTPATSPKM